MFAVLLIALHVVAQLKIIRKVTRKITSINPQYGRIYPRVVKHGQWTINPLGMEVIYNKKISDKWCIFQQAMLDYRRVASVLVPLSPFWFSSALRSSTAQYHGPHEDD